MKVIDLLNKIAKGEEVPKKILLNRIVFEYQGDDYLYKDEDKKEYWLFSACYTDKYMWLEDFLKDEVEIIEEPKKIEKLDIKQEKNIKNNWKWKLNNYCISTPQKIMVDKFNELLKENKELKKQLEKKYSKTGNLTNEILYEENTKLINQQKEFIKYLEDEFTKIQNDIEKEIDNNVKYFKVERRQIITEILQKYKSIIGE